MRFPHLHISTTHMHTHRYTSIQIHVNDTHIHIHHSCITYVLVCISGDEGA